MDQEKIGYFIAKCRKKKDLTQLQLAEKLGVTDRSVSKWENGKCMPDLSLFKQLCEELDITINELLSGEKLSKEIDQKKFEKNITNTIHFSTEKINKNKQQLGITFLIFGVLSVLTAISIFPSESSWSSIYSILGVIFSLIGFSQLIRNLKYWHRTTLNFSFFILAIAFLFLLDFINVKLNHQAPRFSLNTVTLNKVVFYDTPFYDVYRCNAHTEKEYYSIKNNKIYTTESILKFCAE